MKKLSLLLLSVLSITLCAPASVVASTVGDYDKAVAQAGITKDIRIRDILVPRPKGPRSMVSLYVNACVDTSSGVVHVSIMDDIGEGTVAIMHSGYGFIAETSFDSQSGFVMLDITTEPGVYGISISTDKYYGEGEFVID